MDLHERSQLLRIMAGNAVASAIWSLGRRYEVELDKKRVLIFPAVLQNESTNDEWRLFQELCGKVLSVMPELAFANKYQEN